MELRTLIQRLPLPDGEVTVLNGQLRQSRFAMDLEAFVQTSELIDENAHGPAVRDDVMHGDEEYVIERMESDERDSQQWRLREIKRLEAFLAESFRCQSLTLVLGIVREIYKGELQWGVWENELYGSVVAS